MKQNQVSEDYVYDYVLERGREINGSSNPIEMMANEAYGTHGQDDSQGRATESQAMETHYEVLH